MAKEDELDLTQLKVKLTLAKVRLEKAKDRIHGPPPPLPIPPPALPPLPPLWEIMRAQPHVHIYSGRASRIPRIHCFT